MLSGKHLGCALWCILHFFLLFFQIPAKSGYQEKDVEIILGYKLSASIIQDSPTNASVL